MRVRVCALTDGHVVEAGAEAGAPGSGLDVGPVGAGPRLLAHHRVGHVHLLHRHTSDPTWFTAASHTPQLKDTSRVRTS